MSAIELHGVGKRYVQQVDRSLLVKRLLGMQRRQSRELWALRDLDLTVEPGQTVGVIGRNGSGKTTLLRLLSGVSAPTTGRLRIAGRIAPLIGIGIGFNAELSGRENVFVNGQLLGMSAPEITRKFDDIVAFSELEQFIDTPVKYYSSGMFLRLGFSVAVHNEPDVLVVDEVLAVGDSSFQLKSFERMRELQRRGTTIVIVTHNLQALHQMAPRAILLSHGRMVFDGDTDAALGAYQRVLQEEDSEYAARAGVEGIDPSQTRVTGGAQVAVELLDAAGEPSHSFGDGDVIRVRATATFTREIDAPRVGLLVGLPGRMGLFHTVTPPDGYSGRHGPDRPLTTEFRWRNTLLTRDYAVTVSVFDNSGNNLLGTGTETLFVASRAPSGGVVDLEPKVTIGRRRVPLPPVERLGD